MSSNTPLSRRSLLLQSAAVAGGLAIGCAEDSGDLDAGADVGADARGDALVPDSSDASLDVGDAAASLAAGGTAGFIGAFESPFTDEPGPGCELTCEQVLGPCYADVGLDRRDVTDGRLGWPMRLDFRLLQADGCTPLEGATLEIWHTDSEGNYSGSEPAICRPTEDGANLLTFMRGTQTSDAAGQLAFDAIFPGWYPGRTPHIHLTVRVGGEERLTTQIYFRDELAAFAYLEHPDYNHRPVQDTDNSGDGIAQRAGVERFIVEDRRVAGESGSALQCWFTFVIRGAADPSC